MPEVAADVPRLQAGLRGGLADLLKRRIDQARRKALGEATLRFLRPARFCPRRSGKSSITGPTRSKGDPSANRRISSISLRTASVSDGAVARA
jgi:hypothetical protein